MSFKINNLTSYSKNNLQIIQAAINLSNKVPHDALTATYRQREQHIGHTRFFSNFGKSVFSAKKKFICCEPQVGTKM
jgi:hypothetical protein